MKRKKLFLGILLAIIIGVVTGFIFVGKHSHNVNSSKTNATIRIGSKDFTENLVVAEIYALALEDNGYKVQRVSNISSSLIHRSLINKEDGLPGLAKIYGDFSWKSSKVYDNSLKYTVLDNKEADVTPAYTTEGQLINTDKYLLLKDDKHFWPPYNLAPIVRDDVLKSNPKIESTLNKISKKLDTATVTKLNAKVDVEGQNYQKVAQDFYKTIK